MKLSQELVVGTQTTQICDESAVGNDELVAKEFKLYVGLDQHTPYCVLTTIHLSNFVAWVCLAA